VLIYHSMQPPQLYRKGIPTQSEVTEFNGV
jgi:hypothetical protein